MTGFVHILKETSQQILETPSYAVIFAPVGPTGTGGPVPSRNVHGKNELADFLRRMRIGRHSIKDALDGLETNGNATIPWVDLPEDELRNLCLIG